MSDGDKEIQQQEQHQPKPVKKSAAQRLFDQQEDKIKFLQDQLKTERKTAEIKLKEREDSLLKEIKRLHGLISKYTKRFNEFKRLTEGL